MKNISKTTERKAGAMLSYMQIVIDTLSSILYTPVMLRLIGQAEYGLYGTVVSAIGMLSLLNLGFSNSYVKFYSGYKVKNQTKKINNFNALFFMVFAAIAALALIIGLFFSFNLDLVFDEGLTGEEYSKAKIMMLLLTVSTSLGFLLTVFGSYISANEKFIFTKSIWLLSSIITVFSNLAVLFFGYGAVGLVTVSVSLSIIIHIANICFAVFKLGFRFDFKGIEKGLFKQVFVFSGLIAINMIVDKINSGIDSVLLGRFCGTAMVAVYSVGASLNTHFTSFSTAISGIFTPHVHKLVHSYEMDSKEQRRALTSFFVKVGRIQYLILALLASGIVFFGKQFIYFWAGEGYENSYIVALILVLPSVVPLIQNVGIEIQRAESRHHYRSYIYGIMAIGNLLLSIFLCRIWGAIGSAAGTGVAVLLANGLIMNIVYDKKINIDILEFWKNILSQTKGMIIPFVFGALIMKFINIDSIIKLVVFIVLYALVYLACVWLFSMNGYEKDIVKSAVGKIFRRKAAHNEKADC